MNVDSLDFLPWISNASTRKAEAHNGTVKDMAVLFVDLPLYPMPMNTPNGIVYASP